MREPHTQLVSEGEYKRAFERVKMTNKKLSRELAKAQNEIKQRCQNYMTEIHRLKLANPDYKPALPRRQLGFHRRTLDLVLNPLETTTSLSGSSSQWRQKLDFSTAKATRTKETDDSDLGSTSQTKRIKDNIFETVETSRIQDEGRDQEVDRLREELNMLKRQHQQQYEARMSEIRKSERYSDSIGDISMESAAVSEEPSTLEALRSQFEEEIRLAEEKIYVYEAIFVNIYNLLIKDQKDTARTVEEIRSIKYNQLEGKLKTLFGLIRINQDTVMLIEREKQELMEQTQYLSSRVRDLTRNTPAKHDMFAQTQNQSFVGKFPAEDNGPLSSRSRKQSFQITLPQCKTGKVVVKTPNNSDLASMKEQNIAKIKDLYQEQISEKYKQIATLKSTMKTLITQLENSIYTTQGVVKKLKIDKQFVEEDSRLDVNDSFTKRQFTRKKIMRKSVSQTTLRNPISMQHSQDSKHSHLVVEVLKINKQLAQQSRISEVSAEGRDSNTYQEEAFVATPAKTSPSFWTSAKQCLSLSAFGAVSR